MNQQDGADDEDYLLGLVVKNKPGILLVLILRYRIGDWTQEGLKSRTMEDWECELKVNIEGFEKIERGKDRTS